MQCWKTGSEFYFSNIASNNCTVSPLRATLHCNGQLFHNAINAPNPNPLATQSRTQILLLTFFRSSVSSASKRKTKAAAFRFVILVYIGLLTVPPILPACCMQCCTVCPHLTDNQLHAVIVYNVALCVHT